MNHQTGSARSPTQVSNEVCNEGQDALNSTDCLFIPFDTADFMGRGTPAESTGNDCRVWKGGTLLSLLLSPYINPGGRSEWRRDDMIFI